jgi:hypothetical protein
VSSYVFYEDAKIGLTRTFQTAFKKQFPDSPKKQQFAVDILVEFNEAQALKKITIDGMNTLASPTNQASKRLKIRMICKDSHSSLTTGESSSSSSIP